jgi:hypothetical protein
LNIQGRTATAKPLKAMFRCINNGVMTVKPGYQANGNVWAICSDDSSFTLFPISGSFSRTPKDAYNPECLVPTVKHGGGCVMVWAAVS